MPSVPKTSRIPIKLMIDHTPLTNSEEVCFDKMISDSMNDKYKPDDVKKVRLSSEEIADAQR